MTDRKGIRQDGIRTEADLMGRCVVDEDTGCWHWRMAVNAKHRPSMWLPALGRVASIGVAVALLRTGQAPAKGKVWHVVCDTRNCANPAHRRCGDRQSQMLAAKIVRSPVTVARMKIGRDRAGVNKLTPEDVRSIRESGHTLKRISADYRISVGYACEVRSGKKRPSMAAPGSSVWARAAT